jgi:hypothetical protein
MDDAHQHCLIAVHKNEGKITKIVCFFYEATLSEKHGVFEIPQNLEEDGCDVLHFITDKWVEHGMNLLAAEMLRVFEETTKEPEYIYIGFDQSPIIDRY